MEKQMKTRIVHKHDIEVNWQKAINFVPKQGELIIYDDRYVDTDGVEHVVADAVRFKIGNGVDNVNDLAFISSDVILNVEQLPEADIKSNIFYRTAKSIGMFHMNIEGESLQIPATIYYVDTLPETGIETKAENLLTDGYHIYKQKEDNLTYVYSLDDVDNIVKWSAAEFLIVDTVEELNGESGIVISEKINSIYTRNSENTEWVQLLSASDVYTKTEVDEITTGLSTRLDEFYYDVLDTDNQNSLTNEIPGLYNYIDGYMDNVYDLLDDFNSDISTLYNDKLDKITEVASNSQFQVYAVDEGGAQTGVPASIGNLAFSLPLRDAENSFSVGTPKSEWSVTPKRYVDNAVSNILDSSIKWSSEGIRGSISPIESASVNSLHGNRLNFMNPADIQIEYSHDGGATWTVANWSDSDKINLVTETDFIRYFHAHPAYTNVNELTASVDNKLRITITASINKLYFSCRKFLIHFSTTGATSCSVLLEKATIGDESNFIEMGSYDVTGWTGWNSIPCPLYFGGRNDQASQVRKLRFTFSAGDITASTQHFAVLKIFGIGDTVWNGDPVAKNNSLFTYDSDKTAKFPAAVKASDFKDSSGNSLIESINSKAEANKTKTGSTITIDDISASEHIIDVKVISKNMIPPYSSAASQVANTVTYSCEENGQALILNGECTGEGGGRNTFASRAGKFTLEKGKTYTLSQKLLSGSISENGQYDVYITKNIDGRPSVTAINNTNSLGYKTFTATETVECFIGINTYSGTTYNNAAVGFQLEEGSAATEYTPYVDPTTVTLSRYGATNIDNFATFTPNSDGIVKGVGSLYPVTTLSIDTSGATIEATYNSKNNNLIVHETGDSYTKVMSQAAVTESFVQKTDNTSGLYQVYSNNPAGTEITMLSVNPLVSDWSIARRYTDGRLRVSTPVEDVDAATKKYVDTIDSSTNTRVDRLFGTTETVEEAVYYDESKLTYSDSVEGCEYDYSIQAIEMIFNESDFVVNNPIHIKFQAYCYAVTYHAYGYIYKSSDDQIYIGAQVINTDADAALKMCKIDNKIYIVMYLPDDPASFDTSASIPFTAGYDSLEASDIQIIPEQPLYITKEIEVYDTVKEAEHAQTADTATTASTATKASQDSNGYSFTTYYAKAPSSNPLSISGNNLEVKYTKGNNVTTAYSVDLSKANAITSALSDAATAINNAKELFGYEVPGEPVTFDEAALSYQASYENCSFEYDNFFIQLAKSDIEADKDKPIYIRVTEGGQTKDYTIIYSPDNAVAEEREPYITAYSSEDIRSTYWYENDNYIGLSCYPGDTWLEVTASCNIPVTINDDLYQYTNDFIAWLQEVSLEKIEKFTPAACSKGLLAEDGETRLDIAGIKEYVGDGFVAKLTKNNSGQVQAYAVNTDGTQTNIGVSMGNAEYSIARRGAGSTLSVGTPTADAHAATKKYVDDAVANASGSTGWISGYSENASELLIRINCTDGWTVGDIIIPHKPDNWGGYSRSFNYHAIHYAEMDADGYCDVDGIGGGDMYFGGSDYIDQENMYGGGILNGQMVRFSATAEIVAYKI